MSPETTPTKLCPTCGTRLAENATRCVVCGSEFSPTDRPQRSLGAALADRPELQAARLDLRCRSVDQLVAELSGGNQQKVAFGRWLFRGCRVLLCDEPTRGIDVAARVSIHRQLREMAARGLAIVVASSDLPEVIALADRVVVLSGGRVSRVLARGDATEAAIADAAFASHRRAS